MKKAVCIFLITCIIICSSQIMGYDPQASIVYVDDNRPPSWYDATHVRTIDEASDNVSSGGTIYVYSGVYSEHPDITKSVNVVGEDKYTTIIDGGGVGDVVRLLTGNINFSGFTVQNSGGLSSPQWDSGIKCYSHDNRIFDCIFYSNHVGVHSDSYLRQHIYDNYFIENDYSAIRLYDVEHSEVYNNSFVNNSWAIYLHFHCNYNNVTNNYIKDGYGIHMAYHCTYNNARGNSIYNSYLGFDLNQAGDTTSSHDNDIYHNNLFNSSAQDWSSGCVNNWDNGYPSGGNYWSDYRDLHPDAEEIDNSGIWNEAYDNIMYGNCQDDYPLMNPWGVDTVYVDDDFNSATPGWMYNAFDTIELGISRVMNEGTVYVYSGTYYERLNVDKSLSLIGVNGYLNTIIDGYGGYNTIAVNHENVTINGFTIQNATIGVQIVVGDNTTIYYNLLRNNSYGVYIV